MIAKDKKQAIIKEYGRSEVIQDHRKYRSQFLQQESTN